MDLSSRLSISYYEVIATINEPHRVYLVRHRETGRFFVKKILDVYSADVYKDLQEHPITGIPRIIESCETDGQLIIIEEFVSGDTLLDKIEFTASASPDNEKYGVNDILTAERIGRYMISLCETLERLHSHNPPLIHRDLKPSNIIITSFDNVVLLDFNAARFYSGNGSRESDTRLLGTKGYAAPEQYGFGESSPKTDIFSVGKILQQSISALPSEDHTFDDVILKCTQMDPSKRYASAGALRAALMRCIGESTRPDITGKVINPYLPPGFRTLNPWKMLIAAAVYILVFTVSLTLTVKNSSGLELWIERLGILLLALMNIAIGSNYLGVHRLLPFHNSNSPGLRITGVILSMVVATFVFFMTIIFIVGAFYA